MHWILDNLINPDTRQQLIDLLTERHVSFSRVRLIPIFNVLEDAPPVVEGPVFAYGSTGLGAVARNEGWSPGYFDANLDYELMLDQYGTRALNAGAVRSTLADLPCTFDRFFVRPILDNKSFPGSVMTWAEFEKFRSGVVAVANEPEVTLRVTDRIVAAPLIEIAAEYRFFVIAGQVITGSRYKVGDRVESSPVVPESVTEFAQSCADHWCPNEAFALDVAITEEGPKVLEINSANSAGFYACDMGAIIDAVNSKLDQTAMEHA